MRYGNSDEQLFFLPGKTMPLCGPQFIVSGRSPAAPSQVHSPVGPGVPAMQTVNVGWESSVANLISFVVCPEPHCGAVQEASVKLIGSETFATTRPFVGCRVWLVLVVVGIVCFFASVGQLPPPPTQAQSRSTVAVTTTICLLILGCLAPAAGWGQSSQRTQKGSLTGRGSNASVSPRGILCPNIMFVSRCTLAFLQITTQQ